MKTKTNVLRAIALPLIAWSSLGLNAYAQQGADPSSQVSIDQHGTVHFPAYDMPLSVYMSEEAKQAYINQRLNPPDLGPSTEIVKLREAQDRFLTTTLLARAKAVYPVVIEEQKIAGIRAFTVIPQQGVGKRNKDRILISLHGGGFLFGAGAQQLIESIPIAVTTGIKVISIDYRMAPEYKYPAANEDVIAVYKELLKQYRPENIGIYGCSAGGVLTAMTVAWLQKEKLPRPGAVGIFCAADVVSWGDSRYMADPLEPSWGVKNPPLPATPNPGRTPLPYLFDVNPRDPLVSPTLHPEMLAQFPPTLLITGTRDFLLSPVVYAHTQLVKAGIDAELHVWEGMWHSFFADVDLPESKEMYQVTANFFNTHLGKPHQR